MLTKTFKDFEVFKKRRQRLNQLAPDSVFVLWSGAESHLGRFRAESSFVYLTGFEEPDSFAIIRTGSEASFTLFVRPKDPSIEIWDGKRFGPEQSKKEFLADQCFTTDELDEQLPILFKGVERLYYQLGQSSDIDDLVLTARNNAQRLERRSGQAKQPLHEPNEILSRMRMVKEDVELEYMRESCELSARAHIDVMKNVRPGMNERQVQSFLFFSFYESMATQEGYSSIIASGENACTLHYRANNRTMLDGDFLLIDAGAEKNYYTADITRTYPINGKFTEPQRDIYQAVLESQKKLIEEVQVGHSIPELHEKSCELLTQNMLDLGLLKGSIDENLKSGAYKKYYPHGIGHYLGMDVHDIGISKSKGQPEPLCENVVLTIEPGIYVPIDDTSAPKELRGLGVRIEDDVCVKANGPEVLTRLAPKELKELEEIIGQAL